MKKLMSGNEAIARGAWEARSIFGSGYPGENEMFALATGGLRVLRGEEECHTFVKSE